jgi:UDP-glucuronate 4-epimerase
MRVFLTGAAGFIASHLAERLCGRGDAVVGLDNFDPFYGRNQKEQNLRGVAAHAAGRFSFVEGDIRSAAALDEAMALGKPDLVIHLAGLAGVRPSLVEPARYADVNLTGTQRVFDACVRHGVKRIVFASSSSVYGRGSQSPFKESELCLQPLSPYAATKRAGELLGFTAHHLHGFSVTSLRFFTVYGPRQRPDLAIAAFTRRIAAGEPIQLFGDGSTSRDYTWIDDIVDGCLASADQVATDREPVFRIYNLGGTGVTSLKQLVELLTQALGRPATIEWLPFQPGDMPHTRADIALAAHDLGYHPKVSIDEGIKRYVDWFRAST